ncbi:MAG: insulinase family protein [Gemmatimonadetes bacterium]|nr:insulinase family protein [Gemmatimonadota bacterium]
MRTLFVVICVSGIAALAPPREGDSTESPPARPPASGLASPSASQALDVHEHVLDNGFTILVVEDHRTPRVAANLWIRVGSMQEPVGLHGMTHFLEHVIHQGTTTIGTSDLSAELPILREIHDTEQELISLRNRERNRLRERAVFFDELGWPVTPEMRALRERLYELEDLDNEYRDFWTSYKWYLQHGGYARHTDPVPASTEQDYMEMNMALPREHLELFFRLEADRMANAILRGWEAQRFTVLEQVLGGLSRPQTRFNEAIDGVTAAAHPVYLPDGGHLRDFGTFTRAAMQRVYDDYFVPNNATLVLVGDVTLDQIVPLAQRYFGELPRGPEPPADMDVEAEPVPGGSVRLDWTEPLSPQVHVRYRIPGMGHPDRPVLDLIAALLSGPHGIAGQRLAASGTSASASADFRVIHTYRFGSPGAFNLVAQAEADGDLAAVERALLSAVDDLRAGRIDSAAMTRAHKRLRVEWAEFLDNPQELAFLIGHHHTMNHWSVLPDLVGARDAATAADVQHVAATYFVPSNRVIAVARAAPPEGSGPSWLDFLWAELPGDGR